MDQRVGRSAAVTAPTQGIVRIVTRRELAALPQWQAAFAHARKDHRYYELTEDTLTDGFAYVYLVVERGLEPCAIQPAFVIDQDLLAGVGGAARTLVAALRRIWPRFMRARTLDGRLRRRRRPSRRRRSDGAAPRPRRWRNGCHHWRAI